MQLKSAALDKIARFICGDNPLPFPYRSSSKLTTFFTGLGLSFIHRGETRNAWTRDAVIATNSEAPKDGPFPSEDMTAIIEEVMNPTYFDGGDSEKIDYDAALVEMNRVLKQYKLEVVVDAASGLAKMRSVDGHFVSTAHSAPETVKKLTFAPKVFEIPHSTELQHDLVAIMMPFDTAFSRVHDAIKQACTAAALRSKRVDDIWANSTIVQDIFEMIFVAEIVVVDFTGKNPNVMYETGIAHTLGKHVVPITQSIEMCPSTCNPIACYGTTPTRKG